MCSVAFVGMEQVKNADARHLLQQHHGSLHGRPMCENTANPPNQGRAGQGSLPAALSGVHTKEVSATFLLVSIIGQLRVTTGKNTCL